MIGLDSIKNFIAKYPIAEKAGLLFLGITIGALCYPTKHIEEKTSKKYEQQIQVLNQQHSQEVQQITDNYNKVTQEYSSYKTQTDQKVNQLNAQVTDLKKHVKKTYYKIVHPDGTIEVKAETDSDQDNTTQVISQVQQEYKQQLQTAQQQWQAESDQKIADLKKSYDATNQQLEQTISTLEQEKTVEINPRHFGLEVGGLTNQDAYVHANMDLWGPFFMGLLGQAGFGPSSNGVAIGGGLGVRF